jgi:hypothetical protein
MTWTGRTRHDTISKMSYRPVAKKAITVRVPVARLRQVMRARKIATQSELINTLLEEEAEKIASRSALAEAAGTADAADFDDRLL